MVGVSSGKRCHACVKRKKKCDEQKPECGQCLRAGRSCPGYHREHVFTAIRTGAGVAKKEGSPPRSVSSDEKAADAEVSKVAEQVIVKRGRPRHDSILRYAPIDSRNIEKLGYVTSFMDMYYPSNEKKLITTKHTYFSWLTIAPFMMHEDDALAPSLTALAMARIGRRTEDPALVVNARSAIGLSLRKVQAALNDRTLCYRDETLAACMALALVEVFECTSGSMLGWVFHLNGVAKLVKLRGPELHRDGYAHRLFQGFCRLALIVSISSRTSIFLAEPEWTNIPSELNNSNEQRIMSLMFQSGGLAEEFDKINKIENAQESIVRRYKLILRCTEVLEDLSSAMIRLERELDSPMYWPSLAQMSSPEDDEVDGKVFPIAYQFQNLGLAHIYLLYWASKSFIIHCLYSSYEKLGAQLGLALAPGAFPHCSADVMSCVFCQMPSTVRAESLEYRDLIDIKNLPPCPSVNDWRECAIMIAQSVEYCFIERMGLLGPSLLLFPIRFALNVFAHEPGREMLWARSVFQQLNQQRGIPLSEFIYNAQFAGMFSPYCRAQLGDSNFEKLKASTRSR